MTFNSKQASLIILQKKLIKRRIIFDSVQGNIDLLFVPLKPGKSEAEGYGYKQVLNNAQLKKIW